MTLVEALQRLGEQTPLDQAQEAARTLDLPSQGISTITQELDQHLQQANRRQDARHAWSLPPPPREHLPRKGYSHDGEHRVQAARCA